MTKHTYTQEEVKNIISTLGISNRGFCMKSGVNRGDLFKFMRKNKPLSEKNNAKIYKFAKASGFYAEKKKSILQRIVDFIKR